MSDQDAVARRISTLRAHVSAATAAAAPVALAHAAASAERDDSDLPPFIKPNHTLRSNWSETASCMPQFYCQPGSVGEVVHVMRFARRRGLRVKVVGAMHSPNAIPCTDGVMVNLDHMDSIEQVLQDGKPTSLVRCQAGVRLRQLNEVLLERYSLALPSLGSISEQSIAGAVSTATHGTGIKLGVLSSIVQELDLVAGDASVRTYSREATPSEFPGVVISLGALGIVTSLVIRCVPAFRLLAVQRPLPVDQALRELHTLIHSAQHFRFWWFPHTGQCVTWSANPTLEPPTSLPASAANWVKDKLVGYHALERLLWLAKRRSGLVPRINRLYQRMLFSQEKQVVGQSDRVFNFDCLFKQHVDEWAVPVEHAVEAVQRLRRMIRERGMEAHFPVEVRFVAQDDLWLSPAYGRDVCYIGIIVYKPFGEEAEHAAYFRAFDEIMLSLQGRPHWAKPHELTAGQLRGLYPKFDDFLRLRDALDPDRLFTNEMLDRMLGK